MDRAADISLLPENYVANFAKARGVTDSELEALLLALQNQSGAEIAQKLEISQAAVRKRLGESYRKFGIRGSGNKKLYNLRQQLWQEYEAFQSSQRQTQEDWGEAVDVEDFSGRQEEIEELEGWILGNNTQRCRLVAVLGIGGIGKTVLAAKIANRVKGDFEFLIWRSLRNAPKLGEILTQILRFLPGETDSDLLDNDNNKILRLIEILRNHRCLLILDNAESILRSGEGQTHGWAGEYELGYEDYGYFFKKVAEAAHNSSLLLTSREKPKEVAALEGKNLPVKVLQMPGVKLEEAREILAAKGFSCSDTHLAELVKRYSGNPLALKIVATTVYELFGNDIGQFLASIQQNAVYGHIRILLDQQFQRLSELEKTVMYLLAIQRKYISLAELQAKLGESISVMQILEAVESLLRRSLIEKDKNNSRFQQQSVVMEYVMTLINQQGIEDIQGEEKLDFFAKFPLKQGRSLEYIRQNQFRLMLEPVKSAETL
ncbi:NB-ARC domain-containing protein [Calothrix sp. 336/3]|uniref:NB-ARC domain-containing protein n=1 Tax=Calothrix sp. 336/3 TaxID=1337936 RepID=UPI00069ADA2C|nr:NB-ARC domain-containing protein [Calothrix sp. 336/3]